MRKFGFVLLCAAEYSFVQKVGAWRSWITRSVMCERVQYRVARESWVCRRKKDGRYLFLAGNIEVEVVEGSPRQEVTGALRFLT